MEQSVSYDCTSTVPHTRTIIDKNLSKATMKSKIGSL